MPQVIYDGAADRPDAMWLATAIISEGSEYGSKERSKKLSVNVGVGLILWQCYDSHFQRRYWITERNVVGGTGQ